MVCGIDLGVNNLAGLCDFEIASYLFDSYFEIAQSYNIDLIKEGLNLIFAMLLE